MAVRYVLPVTAAPSPHIAGFFFTASALLLFPSSFFLAASFPAAERPPLCTRRPSLGTERTAGHPKIGSARRRLALPPTVIP